MSGHMALAGREKKRDKNSSLGPGHKHIVNLRALKCPLRLKLVVNVW